MKKIACLKSKYELVLKKKKQTDQKKVFERDLFAESIKKKDGLAEFLENKSWQAIRFVHIIPSLSELL